MSRELVLVSGGSGFLGAHCIVSLLKAGYRVRTTVRSQARQADVQAMLRVGGIADSAQVAFVAADLESDAGWRSAAEGCVFVLHVASPFPLAAPKEEDDVIIPARHGALRVLRAARDARVRRVILTSSFAAIGYGHGEPAGPYSEKDWTEVDSPGLGAYVKSKTLAERAAWNFIAREGGALQLAVINPVVIFGPALGCKLSSSLELLQRLMVGSIPWLVRFLALFNGTLAQAVPELGRVKSMTSEKARTLLNWAPRANEEAVIAAATSLVALGSVPAS